MNILHKSSITRCKAGFDFKDFFAIGIIFGILTLLTRGLHQMSVPFEDIVEVTISLDPTNLPDYALQTILRFFIAMIFALIFAISYGTLAAKNKYAETILVPLLDIFQSVPVLGFISFTVAWFLMLFPGSSTGLQITSIFAAFTNQVPNMTFSIYQSLKTVPEDLSETCTIYRISPLQKFLNLELPLAMPGLIWNCMMSMSGGWFLIVATEAITVNQQLVMLPGIGSYIAEAIRMHSLPSIGYAVLCMMVVIFAYDQLIFRPLVTWSDKFHLTNNENAHVPKSLILTILQKTRVLRVLYATLIAIIAPISHILNWLPHSKNTPSPTTHSDNYHSKLTYIWYFALTILAIYGLKISYDFVTQNISWSECITIAKLGFFTMLRVVSMIFLASLIWVPIGVYVGCRPALAQKIEPLAQFLAAFPANIVFPLAVIYISKYHLDPNIWLSPLMVLGTQWYILFNVIAGASAFPTDLVYAANIAGVKGRLWWQKVMLPSIFPYFITGAITAAGGAWNASIVAEVVSWGQTQITAEGIGAYIAQATATSDIPHVIISIGIMSTYVLMLNRLIWQPLYNLAQRQAKLG